MNQFANPRARLPVNLSVTLLENRSVSLGVTCRVKPEPMLRGIRVPDLPQVARCRLLQVDRSALRVVPCPRHPDARSVRRVVPCPRHLVVRVRLDRAPVVRDTADRVQARRDLQEVSADLARADRALVEHSEARDPAAVREHPVVVPVVQAEEDDPVADLVRVADVVHREVADVVVGAERTISSRR